MGSTCRTAAGRFFFLLAAIGAFAAIGPNRAHASSGTCEDYKVLNGFVPHETFDPFPAAECTKLVRASGPPVILGIDVTGTLLRFDGISSNPPAGLVGATYYVDDRYVQDVSIELASEYRTPTPIIYNRGLGTKVEADTTLPVAGIRFGPGVSGEWTAAWIAPAGLYVVRVRPSSRLTLDEVIARLIVLPPAPPADGNSPPLAGPAERWHLLGVVSLALLSALCVVAGILKLRHAGQFREVVQTWGLPRGISRTAWWWLPASEVVVGALGGVGLVSPELRLAASLSVLLLFLMLFLGQVYVFERAPGAPCGCLGGGESTVHRASLLRGSALLALALLTLFSPA